MRQSVLFFKQQALADLRFYVKNSPANCEIGGIGKIERLPGGYYTVTEVKLIKQTVQPAHVSFGVEAYEEFFSNLPDGEDHGLWRFQWHSHVNMGTAPSGTDLKDYDEFIDQWDQFTPLIFNRRDEFHGWTYTKIPTYGLFKFDHIWPYELRQYWPNVRNKAVANSLSWLFQFVETAQLIDKTFSFSLETSPERAAILNEQIKALVVYNPSPVIPAKPMGNYAQQKNFFTQEESFSKRNYNSYHYYNDYEDDCEYFPSKYNIRSNGMSHYPSSDLVHNFFLVDDFNVSGNSRYKLQFATENSKAEFKQIFDKYCHIAKKAMLGKNSESEEFYALVSACGLLPKIEESFKKEGYKWDRNEKGEKAFVKSTDIDGFSILDAMFETYGFAIEDEEIDALLNAIIEEGIVTESPVYTIHFKDWQMTGEVAISNFIAVFATWYSEYYSKELEEQLQLVNKKGKKHDAAAK